MKRILLFLAIGGTLPSASLVSSSCGSIVSKGPDTLIINTTNPGLEDGGQSQKNAPKPIVAACGNNSPKTTMTQTTTPNPENATRAQQFLKKAGTYYLATVEGDQPRVRPFGTAEIFEGRLYIQTGKVKNVYKQLLDNPKAEICAFVDGEWIRIAGELIADERIEAKKDMLDKNPSLRGMYDENDDNTIVLFFQNATATISAFTHAPESFEF